MKKVPRELLAHEAELVERGVLRDVTHAGARSHFFEAAAGCSRKEDDAREGTTLVYRHMGDRELFVLLERCQLPSTQPYQTLVRGDQGLAYCRKYLTGKKRVDTGVTTIVEFAAPTALVDSLFATFHKAEDGCISTGLGDKAGNTLPLFNAGLADGSVTFCPIVVKRAMRKGK
jgi:hypothetical protein